VSVAEREVSRPPAAAAAHHHHHQARIAGEEHFRQVSLSDRTMTALGGALRERLLVGDRRGAALGSIVLLPNSLIETDADVALLTGGAELEVKLRT
jgi:hypothetical protein